MKIDTTNFETGEFAFYLQTNGPVSARAFRDFLDVICGNSPKLRRIAPMSVEILELNNGSIRGRLLALFADDEWSDRQASRKQAALDRSLVASKEAIQQVAVAQQANQIALAALYQQMEGNKKLDTQNRINLGIFLAAIAALLSGDTPTTEASIICNMMEGGVVCFELASRDHHWVIERADAAEYRARTAIRSERLATRHVRADSFEGDVDTGRIADEALTELKPHRMEEARIAVPKTTPIQRVIGRATRDGDVYSFYPEDEAVAESVTLVAPENQDLFDDTCYEVSGRLYRIKGQPPLLVARRAVRMTD